jgi:hypothetical protein
MCPLDAENLDVSWFFRYCRLKTQLRLELLTQDRVTVVQVIQLDYLTFLPKWRQSVAF